MSGTTGAPNPPDRPPSGSAHSESPTTNNRDDVPPSTPSGWVKDEKTKTCKCESCGNRVRIWSYKCRRCGRHICSECLDGLSSKPQFAKDVAKDHINERCWHTFPGNMNPKFAHKKPPPPVRTEEERRAKASKALSAVKTTISPQTQSPRWPAASRSMHEAHSPSPVDDPALSDPDDDYEGPATSGATITANKTQRSGVKRKSYLEQETDTESSEKARPLEKDRLKKKRVVIGDSNPSKAGNATVSQAASRQLSHKSELFVRPHDAAHLDEASTAIVGAGFIGLFVARELALEALQHNVKHNIIVVDIRGNYCELASGNCAGFLTAVGLPDSWSSLANEANEWWHETVSSADFRQRVRFSATNSFEVTATEAKNHDRAPSWLEASADMALSEDRNAIGRVDSIRLAVWLYEQCDLLGINFRFNHFVSGVHWSGNTTLSGVQIHSTHHSGSPGEVLNCQKLVLSSGPFTSLMFEGLFPNNPLTLQNHVQSAHWFKVDVHNMQHEEDVGLRFPQAPHVDGSSQTEIRMSLRTDDEVLAVSVLARKTDDVDLDRAMALKPRTPKTDKLVAFSARTLNRQKVNVTDNDQSMDKGRSELSVANGGNPIIDKVPPSGLGRLCHNESNDNDPCGVWLCYGFGRHGTMLAPGAARMLVSKMFGMRSEQDDTEFRIPEYTKPKAVVKGKGKGRAKD